MKCHLKEFIIKLFLNAGTLKYVSTGNLAGLLLLLAFVDKNHLMKGCFWIVDRNVVMEVGSVVSISIDEWVGIRVDENSGKAGVNLLNALLEINAYF